MPAALLDTYLGEYFDGLLAELAAHPDGHTARRPCLCVHDTEGAYVVTLPAPGVALEAVTVAVHDGLLTLRAPGLYRTAYLPEPVDAAARTLSLADGVLTLTFPRCA